MMLGSNEFCDNDSPALIALLSVASLEDAGVWCFSPTDPRGSIKDFKYTASGGLSTSTC